jgi:enoyl-CoA hydratase
MTEPMIHRESIEREGQGPIVVLRMERGRANALDLELLNALDESLQELDDQEIGAVILTGTGSIFSAGVDLFRVLDTDRDYLVDFLGTLHWALRRLFTFPRPVVAAVNGHAIAGGCILVCACDHRVMADAEGRIGVPELRVGVPFPTAPLEVLRFAVPRQLLQTLTYTGKTYGPADALSWGLVDELVAPDELMDRAVAAAGQLAAIPPGSFEVTKQHLRRPTVERIDALLGEIDEVVTRLWNDPAIREHIREYLDRTLKKR